jgi:hypothetical protein
MLAYPSGRPSLRLAEAAAVNAIGSGSQHKHVPAPVSLEGPNAGQEASPMRFSGRTGLARATASLDALHHRAYAGVRVAAKSNSTAPGRETDPLALTARAPAAASAVAASLTIDALMVTTRRPGQVAARPGRTRERFGSQPQAICLC